MVADMSISHTSTITRGRNQIRLNIERLASRVTRSVAADEKKAHALGVRVREATSSKSWALISVSRGGLPPSRLRALEAVGGGRVQVESIVLMSRSPRCFVGGRPVMMTEGAWMAL